MAYVQQPRKRKSVYDKQIPFNSKGDVLHYPRDETFIRITATGKIMEDDTDLYGIVQPEFPNWTKEPVYRWSSDYNAALKDGRLTQEVSKPVWRDNFLFSAKLKVIGYERRDSAANVIFQLVSGDGQIVVGARMQTPFADFIYAIQNSQSDNGVIDGQWTFMKGSSYYYVRFMTDEDVANV